MDGPCNHVGFTPTHTDTQICDATAVVIDGGDPLYVLMQRKENVHVRDYLCSTLQQQIWGKISVNS